jgi:hypothetical protein
MSHVISVVLFVLTCRVSLPEEADDPFRVGPRPREAFQARANRAPAESLLIGLRGQLKRVDQARADGP